MTGVLKPLGTALTRLPFGPGSPDHTVGALFQMYYQADLATHLPQAKIAEFAYRVYSAPPSL